MTSNVLKQAVKTVLLASVSAAATINATSGWVDVTAYEGPVVIVVNTGVVTAGSITWTVEDATDGAGAGAAGIVPDEGAFTVVTTANDPLFETRTIRSRKTRGFIRVVGTIATGPALVAAHIEATPKYA